VAGVVVLAARVVEDVVMTVDAADTTHTDLVVKMQRELNVAVRHLINWLIRKALYLEQKN
jgi:hypothetical protein